MGTCQDGMSDWYHKLPSVHAWAASSARLADASAATAASPARAAASRASRTASAAPASPNARTIAPRHAAASLPVKVHPFRQSPFLCPSRRLVRALRIPNPTHRQPYTASPTPPASRHGPASRATLTPLVIAPRLLKPGRCARVRAYALTLAGNFEKVAGVEVSETSCQWARNNAAANGIGNANFMTASAEAIFGEIDFPKNETAVVIDPPRKGCTPEFLEQLIAFHPSRIVYVSCDPATQIRDLKQLSEGGYRLLEVQPFDLFPHTRHLECVMTLVRD